MQTIKVLLKLTLARRVGVELQPVLQSQRAALELVLGRLETSLERLHFAEDPAAVMTLSYKLESVSGLVRFVDHLVKDVRAAATTGE